MLILGQRNKNKHFINRFYEKIIYVFWGISATQKRQLPHVTM